VTAPATITAGEPFQLTLNTANLIRLAYGPHQLLSIVDTSIRYSDLDNIVSIKRGIAWRVLGDVGHWANKYKRDKTQDQEE
jgi:hypothetical protein